MKTVKLSELLNKDQLAEVERITLKPYTLERTVELQDFLCTLQEHLEKFGVLPEYLTYVIEYQQMKALAMFEAEERENAKNN